METHPTTAEKRDEARIGLITLISVGIGFGAGLIAFALYHLIGFLTNLFYFQRISFTFATPDQNTLGVFVILMPVIGGLVAGLMIKYGSTKIIGHGIPEAMESVLMSNSKIEPKVGVLKALSAAFTIGSGQPFGAEGPIIQTGGAFGSLIGQLMSTTGSERRIILACGAAAGMAATFGTPVAAIFLVVELLLFEFRVKSLVPVGVASAIGGWMHIYLISSRPLFATPTMNFGGMQDLPYFIVLGLICGVVGTALSRGLYKMEDVFKKIRIGQPWLPAIGGLIVGLFGFFVPQILGVGYDVILNVLETQYVVQIIALIMVAKAVSWLLAMGSQTSGGTLAPLFLIGASVGSLYGSTMISLFHGSALYPGVFAMAAMGAVFGTASRAPLTSILFVLEVTQQFQGAITVIITVLIAELVGEYLMEDSIMTEKLTRRGLRVRHIYEYNPLRQTRVSNLMSKPLVAVDASEKAVETFKMLNSPESGFWNKRRLIVMKDGSAIGYVDKDMLLRAASQADSDLTMEKIKSDHLISINQDELAYEAQKKMILEQVPFLLVVDGLGDPVGYISRGDLLAAQKRKIIDETVVERRK
ncbi:MAG: chloride channel protein [Thaumarchaeota archaeon]|nr:chloride channel protein [Nitrososphaerota archaeon]